MPINKNVDINLNNVIIFQSKNNLTDMQMAEKMGISTSFYSKVKTKKRVAGRSFIFGLILAGMDPKDIFIIE
nr:MAG: hypothetical protein [Bacteriophage sp.]